MIELRCLGSGSSGNCWLLESENEVLILDCGVPIKEIKVALDFNISKVVGVTVTHCHIDHLLSAKDFEKLGIPVFKPYESEMERRVVTYGGFVIKSFKVPHDGTPCCGFLVSHKELPGNLLYLTDLEYCPYTFRKQNIHTMIVEANYSKEYISEDEAKFKHVLRGHCEIEQTLGIIEANKTNALQNVILAHLSVGSADPIEFKAKAEKVAKCGIYVATKGLEVNLADRNVCPF